MNMQERLRFLRTMKGLTEEQLGRELDVDPEDIKGWENGQTIYSDTLVKYADFFNTTIDFIVCGGDNTVPEITVDGEPLSDTERTILEIFRGFNKQGKLDLISAFPRFADKGSKEDAEKLAELFKEALTRE